MRPLLTILFVLMASSACTAVHSWPPDTGSRYPDLDLFDLSGSPVKLSELSGKVLLLQPVRMACSACQTFSGSHRWGPFGAVLPQAGLPAIESLLESYAPGAKSDPDFQMVQIVFFNFADRAPVPADLAAWDRHFHLHERNILLFGARQDVADDNARRIIPGFQLIDRYFILRADSTGASPRADLRRDLLPAIPTLLKERHHLRVAD